MSSTHHVVDDGSVAPNHPTTAQPGQATATGYTNEAAFPRGDPTATSIHNTTTGDITSTTSSTTSTTNESRPLSEKLKGSASGAKGVIAAVHGAGEALRGNFNAGVDRAFNEVCIPSNDMFPHLGALSEFECDEEKVGSVWQSAPMAYPLPSPPAPPSPHPHPVIAANAVARGDGFDFTPAYDQGYDSGDEDEDDDVRALEDEEDDASPFTTPTDPILGFRGKRGMLKGEKRRSGGGGGE